MAQTNPVLARLTIVVAGIFGGGGVMAAAGAAHGGEGSTLGSIAMICLAHGPALLALGLSAWGGRLVQAAALLLGLGTMIFAGDLLVQHSFGHAAFPLAAPLGGVGMIGGWLCIIAVGAFGRAAGR